MAGDGEKAATDERRNWDVARQAANVAGALVQVGMTAYASAGISGVVDQGPRSPVEPALYGFFIWGPIFGLSLAYAGYQALPRNRTDPLLRRIGWFTAGAFLCTGLWSVFVPREQTLAALGVFLVAWLCLLRAYLALMGTGRTVGRGARWLVALPVGMFLGWVTAADLVSVHSELVRGGVLAAGRPADAAVGAGLLLLGGGLAAAIVAAGTSGPVQGVLAYGGTVLWALAAVIVNQVGVEPLTAGAAALAAAPVALVLLGRRPTGPLPAPGVGETVASGTA